MTTPHTTSYEVVPIGVVSSPRKEITDDHWGGVEAVIRLDSGVFGLDALAGLDTFSHLEVVFLFHKVAPEQVHRGARHPRGNAEWPQIGVLAQRVKNRPNRLGVSRCELLKVEGADLYIRGLDAIDGTPVLDIKPYMTEFAPRGEVRQPAWSHELMHEYY
ncbi:SAM-dependent methyltransferase [Streptomyces sp. NPDC002667]|uniref:SAM-dependent methyltransferase n=1 Tax=Streptomyces sp. NPDC002667 TaxID=3364657 RepID=UPI0036B178CD